MGAHSSALNAQRKAITIALKLTIALIAQRAKMPPFFYQIA
jgi:hypothetical protein